MWARLSGVWLGLQQVKMHVEGILGGGTSISKSMMPWSSEWRTRHLQRIQENLLPGVQQKFTCSTLTTPESPQGSQLVDMKDGEVSGNSFVEETSSGGVMGTEPVAVGSLIWEVRAWGPEWADAGGGEPGAVVPPRKCPGKVIPLFGIKLMSIKTKI